MSLAKMRVLSCPGLRHDHDVFKLEEVLEFGLLFAGDATLFGAVRQLGHALPRRWRRMERDHRFRRRAGGDELDDFVERFVAAHPLVPPAPYREPSY